MADTDLDYCVSEVEVLEVDDVLEGAEPGAACNVDELLFAADSFEDLTNEIVTDKLDGESSHKLQTIKTITGDVEVDGTDKQHTYDTQKSEPASASTDDCDGTLPSETLCNGSSTTDEGSGENELDEARITRAQSVEETTRKDSVEEVDDPNWKLHKKHVFVLSEAGKPIYSRYGNEEKLVTMMGLMQAIVSFVQDANDNIRSIHAGDHKFVFLVRGPLILVTVCSSQDSKAQLQLQLTYVYHQILSVLTFTQLTRIFEQRRNYDLRKHLSGTEKFIDNLLRLMSQDPSFLLQSVRCLPLPNTVRDTIGQSLQSAKDKELVFAILVVENQLVTMVRPKKFSLHPSDLHLIFNLVSGSTAWTYESWAPICLPRFDNSGYLYGHISYLTEECTACLLLLSTDRNAFFNMSECKKKIMERLEKHKCIQPLCRAVKNNSYSIGQVGIQELWHFVYKSRSTAQFTSPKIGAPYTSDEEQERLFGLYLYLHHRIHSSSRPLKILCYSTKNEMVLGWVTSGFELYATFSPLTSKASAIHAVNKLLRWIKKEEDVLFIINSYTF